MAAYAARLVIACYIFLSHFFVTIIAHVSGEITTMPWRFTCVMRVQAVLSHLMKTCFMKVCFVDAMFPNHKLEDLSESQCEAMFRLLTL